MNVVSFKKKITIREFLREYAPNYCYCTANDLFLMYEQIDENVDLRNFRTQLSAAKKEGVFFVKDDDYIAKNGNRDTGKNPQLYLRIEQ